MTKDQFFRQIRKNLIRNKGDVQGSRYLPPWSLQGYERLKVLIRSTQFCGACSQFSPDGFPPVQIQLGNGDQAEVYFCEKCKEQFEKLGLQRFGELKAEEARSRAFDSIKKRYGDDPKKLSFIADHIAEFSKPDVRKEFFRFMECLPALLSSRSLPPTVEGFCDLMKKQFPPLSKLLDSTLKLHLATKPLSVPRIIEWLFRIIRQAPLGGFGIYDPPRVPETEWEASLKVGRYVPGSLDMEILVGLCEKIFPKILQVKGEVQPYIRKSANNKRIDLIRHEFFLARGKGEEELEGKGEFNFDEILRTRRRKFNESEVDLDEIRERDDELSGFESLHSLESVEDNAKVLEIEKFVSSFEDPIDQQIGRMSFIYGKTIREIAEVVPIKRSAVSKRLRRIKEEFAHKFQTDPLDL